jgi:hypothetical protein
MNLCLQDSSDQKESKDSDYQVKFGLNMNLRRRKLTEGISDEKNLFCTPALRGLFLRTHHPNKKPVPSKILIFPGTDISHFLSMAQYPSDGRHYGSAMYLPFLRTFQGIAHEYALATPDLQSHFLALEDSVETSRRNSSTTAWNVRLHSCDTEIHRNPESR